MIERNEGLDRRRFLRGALATGAALGLAPGVLRGDEPEPAKDPENAPEPEKAPLFRISLAQWSLHRALQAGELDTLDFVKETRETYGLDAVEYVNSFFKDHARNAKFLARLRSRCEDQGVTSLLIMCDGEGRLGDPDEAARGKAVENHLRWLDAARILGCHSIRVNAASEGTREEQIDRAADGLRRLSEAGAERGLNVIVENHGGLSSDGAWLAEVMKKVDHPRCGTLPDFGNFQVSDGKWYDRYRGVEELMPFAKAVSAKSHEFDEDGNEVRTDYRRMMRIVLGAGYRGYVGIEYEGGGLPEKEGILATKKLLETVRGELSRSGEFDEKNEKNEKNAKDGKPGPTSRPAGTRKGS